MNIRAIIPNLLTSLNLVFGMCSMMATYNGDTIMAAVFILLALVADGLDGRAARFFGVSGELGKEMDSLCDCVSFGAAPGFLAYAFVMHNFGWWGAIACIVYALFGMGRLARFNVNASTIHGYFMGVPIPAGGCFIATWILFSTGMGFGSSEQLASLGWSLPLLLIILGYLLLSKIKYPDFKGKGEKISKIAIAIVVIMALFILYWGIGNIVYAVLFDIFCSYIILGLVNTLCTIGQK